MRQQCFLFVLVFFLFWFSGVVGCTSYNKNSEGLRYLGQSRYNEAKTAFEAALKVEPNNADTYYNLATTYHQSGKISLQSGQSADAQLQYDQALRHYQLALTYNPNHTEAHRGLAVLYMETQNADAAFKLLIDWYNTNVTSAEPKIELARLYQEYAQICQLQNRTDIAKECLDSASKMLQSVLVTEPANYRALRALGYLKEQNGDWQGAIADYQRSFQSNPQQKDLENRISTILQGK
ncbi:MAG: tetratricopeptide repeat protein [Planctomycetaceae bacterium]|jgi:tetratricopeptide (TPR) repeat protein|nr:tetratricopeptide repeat protein [Planctomycetaceae bacterium]